MAKREFIETREIVYVNAPISPILQGDSVHYEDIAFKAQIGRIRTFPEQEIVKPYLEKLKEQIRYDYNRNIWGQYEYEKVMDCINNLLLEQETK